MNLDADVTYQTVDFFSSGKCFIYFISDEVDKTYYNRWNQHSSSISTT